jgi:EAL domain-containing protein (putative c-di-GMP-specific phosphodiesterase class I)
VELTQESARVVETREWASPAPDWRANTLAAPLAPLRGSTLRRALAGSGLETRYQPMVDMRSRRTVAMEALVRLNLSRHLTLFPGDFLPQVEEAGLGGALTDAVAGRSFNDWALLPGMPARPQLSINLSLDVLLCDKAIARLEARRRAAGLPADAILIELTESRPVDDLLRLREVVQTIRAIGYAIALDDITPSVPHLDSLIDMDFTDLKLDKAVIQAAPHWPQAVAFIERIVQRAEDRNLIVTAEGVEDEITWVMMRALGIRQAQGFLIGRPMNALDIPGWLIEWADRQPV